MRVIGIVRVDILCPDDYDKEKIEAALSEFEENLEFFEKFIEMNMKQLRYPGFLVDFNREDL